MRGPALLAVGFLAGILTLAPPAAAATPEAGPEVAVRVGLALPVGDVQSGSSLDTYASLAVPLVLEGGYDTADGYVRLGGTTTSGSRDISDTTWHGWIAFGVRGAFGF
jgi:hypothetical protein